MFQVHNVANEADFARGMLEGSYQCSKCFQYSERQWCGALRASEWDRETGIMTIWHQGKHICLMKKPSIEKDDVAKMITMFKHIMQLNSYATKTKSWTSAVSTIYQEGTIGCHNYLQGFA